MGKSVEKIEDVSSRSSWIKTIMTPMVLISAIIIAVVLHDPATSNLPIQDITTSASSAVDVLSQLQYDAPAQLAQPASAEIIAEHEPEPVEEIAANEKHQAVDIIEWMIAGGAVFPNIEIVEYSGRDEYRGIHAKSDMNPDEVFAEIPDQFIITFDKARDSEIGQRLIQALPEYDDLEMSHYMISLFLVVEYDKGQASWWWPYIRTLPRHFQNMPPNYTPDEIKLSRESRLDSVVEDRLQKDYDEICDALSDFCLQHSFETYKWARLVLRSRAFSLDRNGIDQTALQPFVDMINHDFDNVASWRYDQDRRLGQIYAKRSIKAGDVVTISYGAKSNRVLLRTYGFVIKNNPNHEAPLYLQLPDGEAASGMLARRVPKTGNPSTEFYRILHTITLSTSDDEFKAAMKLCRVSVATSDELDQHDEFDRPVSLRNEAEALRYLQESIDSTLYKHTITIDDDEKLLETSLSDNERNIIMTRQSEKLTLIMMNEIIEDLLDLAHPSVDQRTFNKQRYHQKYADHQKYVRSLVELRRTARLMQ